MKKNVGFERQQVVEAIKRALADGSNVIMATDLRSEGQMGVLRTIRGEGIQQYIPLLDDLDTELIGISGEGECLFTESDYESWMIHFDLLVDSTWIYQVQFDPYYLFA